MLRTPVLTALKCISNFEIAKRLLESYSLHSFLSLNSKATKKMAVFITRSAFNEVLSRCQNNFKLKISSSSDVAAVATFTKNFMLIVIYFFSYNPTFFYISENGFISTLVALTYCQKLESKLPRRLVNLS